jgi:DNA-binding beta-propeller fold protein YncE
MAVSPDGTKVYVAIFESGNRSTVLGGGSSTPGFFPPNVVNIPQGPYGGLNPPPNSGAEFDPPQNPDNPPPPAVSHIVKKNADGAWLDDNDGDWQDLVSGVNAPLSGRPVGWDLLDHDLAVIDAASLVVSYVQGLMNLCMALAVNPATDQVTVVGTEALNEIRFEPILNSRFLRVHLGIVDTSQQSSPLIVDLNPQLTYAVSTIPQAQRDLSIGDPRGIVWNSQGTRGYVAGMGSNNLVIIDAAGNRAGLQPTVEVGEGPTGLALDEARQRLYVLNKFEASISVVDTVTETELSRAFFYDPSPPAVKVGRVHLYGTHETSGLGHVACASCHPDARMDRLAWDLGNPAGEMKTFNQNCNFGSDGPDDLDGIVFLGPGPCLDWHPMKGPMVTQTLQDIIGKEPHHWRGDRDGLEEFNQTFVNLQGTAEMLTAEQMQEFEDLLATIHLPPNPFRTFDNNLPTDLPLPGHFFAGVGGPEGQPLPNGNAGAAFQSFLDHHLINTLGISCSECHTLPTGMGTNDVMSVDQNGVATFEPFPVGPNGELHHGVVLTPLAETPHISIKIPQLRNLHEKVGFEMTQTTSRAGFGFLHDGSVDSLARFMSEPPFIFEAGIDAPRDQLVAGMVAFMLSFSGSDVAVCNGIPTGPCGSLSQDSHASVGRQVTVDDSNKNDAAIVDLIDDMMGLADDDQELPPGPQVGLVAKGLRGGLQRGYAYLGAGLFQADRLAQTLTGDSLRLSAAAGSELTFTVVPAGTELRVGIDRDEDGVFDRDELDACSDPASSASVPDLDVTVPALLLGRAGTDVLLSWNAVGASWDVLLGDLDALKSSGGDFTAATLACLADDSLQPTLVAVDPAGPGSVFFLVRAECAGGTTYDSGGTGQAGVRDNEINASALSCPG